MLTAHAQDYERKRKPEAGTDGADDDASSDSDDGKSRRSKPRRKRDQDSRLEAFQEEPQMVDPDDVRDRMDTATAEEIFDLARPR